MLRYFIVWTFIKWIGKWKLYPVYPWNVKDFCLCSEFSNVLKFHDSVNNNKHLFYNVSYTVFVNIEIASYPSSRLLKVSCILL